MLTHWQGAVLALEPLYLDQATILLPSLKTHHSEQFDEGIMVQLLYPQTEKLFVSRQDHEYDVPNANLHL